MAVVSHLRLHLVSRGPRRETGLFSPAVVRVLVTIVSVLARILAATPDDAYARQQTL